METACGLDSHGRKMGTMKTIRTGLMTWLILEPNMTPIDNSTKTRFSFKDFYNP